MSYTRNDWARSFLNSIGNNAPNDAVVNWVVNWTKAESDNFGHGATYNLLNTTQSVSGSTLWEGSTIGIQNFANFNMGVDANAVTLKNGLYSSLLKALQNNDTVSLGIGTNGPSAGVKANLNTWCGACGYGNSFATQSGHGGDAFQGSGPSPVASGSSGAVANAGALAQKAIDWFNSQIKTQTYGQNSEQGIDLAPKFHTPVEASYGGKVLFAGKTDWGDGTTSGGLVAIQTVVNGAKQIYYVLHLDTTTVKVGDTVNPGDMIGLSGGQLSGGNWNVSPQFTTGAHIEEGFNATFLNAGNVHVGTMPGGFNPVSELTNKKDIAASVTGGSTSGGSTGGSSNSSSSGGSNTSGAGGSFGGPTDPVSLLTDTLKTFPQTFLDSFFKSDYVQRSLIIFIALTIILVGVVILFFSHGGAEKTAEVAAAAA